MPEIAHPSDATLVAEKIIQTFDEPVRIDEHLPNVTTSIGVAVYPINGTHDAKELMKKGRQSNVRSKEGGAKWISALR